MAARSGMTDLITQWRAMIGNVGTAVLDDDRAQQILDNHRLDFYAESLATHPLEVSGSVVYHIYTSGYRNLEGTASGTVAWRVYDSNGTARTPDTIDQQTGTYRYTADQKGSARYLDGRAFNLNGAAADGWRDLMGLYSSYYDFSQEGRSYSRSQWFTHCSDMASYYDAMPSTSRTNTGAFYVLERGDMI